jgi:hypothetical protein
MNVRSTEPSPSPSPLVRARRPMRVRKRSELSTTAASVLANSSHDKP